MKTPYRPPASPRKSDHRSDGPDIESRLLEVAYERKALNMWLQLAVAPIGMALVWSFFTPTPVLAWGIAVMVASLLGLLEISAFKRAVGKARPVRLWRAVFVSSWIAQGLAWSSGPAWLLQEATGPGVAILVAILFAVCTAVVVSAAEIRESLTGIILAILIPPAVSAFLSPVAGQATIGWVLLVSVAPLVAIGLMSSANFRAQMSGKIRLQNVLDHAADAVIRLDSDLKITNWNARAEAMFGHAQADVLGLQLAEAILPLAQGAGSTPVIDGLVQAKTGSPGIRQELLAQHSSGRFLTVEVAFSRYTDQETTTYTAFIADISQRKEAEEKLALFRRVIEASSHCVVVSDGNGYGLYQNAAHAQAMGYTDAEMAGQHFSVALPAGNAQAIVDEISRAVLASGSWSDILEFQRKDGSLFTSRSSIGAIVNSQGKIQYLFNIFTDITEILASREALRLAKEEAERASRAKSDFLSSMSHELRTPMNAILGFAQIMEYDETLGQEQKDNLKEIIKGGDHLLRLINQVLDLSAIEAGQVSLTLEELPLLEVLQDCWRLMEPLVIANGLTFHKQIDGNVFVRADRTRFKQVLLNLLSNAVKYNRPQGEIAVRSVMQADGRVRLEVSDTGEGIHPDSIKDLFSPFNRLGKTHSGIEGTGVGLSVTRQLVELMHGEVGVFSEPQVGTTFWIDLPGGRSAAPLPAARPPEQPVANVAKCVLSIDDNPINLKLIAHILRQRPGIELISATSPGVGIQMALGRKPDLILLDINMPGMDGYQVLEVLKTYERTKYIPIIAVTANTTPRDEDQGGLVGLDAYITKPIQADVFLKAVDTWLAASKSPATPAQPTERHWWKPTET